MGSIKSVLERALAIFERPTTFADILQFTDEERSFRLCPVIRYIEEFKRDAAAEVTERGYSVNDNGSNALFAMRCFWLIIAPRSET